MDDLVLDRDYKRGDQGVKVRLIQEWLCLDGFQVVIDGAFGPATEVAVRQFQVQAGVEVDGVVGPITFSRLVLPITRALAPVAADSASLGAMVVSYAKQHLAQRPREVGGQNSGPWVRLYMNGHDGPEWPWCAGFASFMLTQACTSVSVPVPVTPSVSCDSLAASAKQNGRFIAEAEVTDRARLTPGSLFLNRRTATDWVHTGVILDAQAEVFQTIEGNTNDDGSREGYEVCQRVRGYASKDFILI
ncbi:MAG TPA: peptidoglycan-binding domain-containing protein [Gemmatimonadales bacterium]|jgi:hypothetical protein